MALSSRLAGGSLEHQPDAAAVAAGLIRQGKNQKDVAKVLTDEYTWAPDIVYMPWSLPRLMTELK